MSLKIWKITFNDGGWHQSLPTYQYVAKSESKAKKMALEEHPCYKTWSCWATEFKIEGYVIEVYDERTHKREKSIEKVLAKNG